MRDKVIAAIRTGTVLAVSTGVAALVAWLANFSIVLDPAAVGAIETSLATVAAAAVVGLVNLVLNKAQERWPWVGRVLSLGLSSGTPSYK